jgi:hypothetical protein
MEKDPYGNRLKTIMSSDLLSLINHPSVTDGWKTKAAWAYIAQLPLDWPIVLYWH